MHWCPIETQALMIVLSALPLVGLFFRKLHARWHAKWKHFCHDKGCHHTHTEPQPLISEESKVIWQLAGFDSEAAWEEHIKYHPEVEITNE